VVWLVFEELDPAPGLELPELDRLHRESVSAGAARAPAATTELVLPSLVTGRRVVAVAPINPNDLELRYADGKRARFSTESTVFGKARALGYDGAVVGWRLPYPRVLGASLGFGDWRPSAAHEQARGATVGEAFRNQWWTLAPPVHLRRLSAERLAELGDLAFRAATDGRFGLVLLHLPLPRLPGVYDAATARLTAWNFAGPDAEAADNLALVDRLLGELRRGLERARLDDRTWLVVTSTPTPRDAHVPYLVRPPDGSAPAHVDGEVSTLATHDLVLAILRGTVGDGPAAATWLRRNGPLRERSQHGALARHALIALGGEAADAGQDGRGVQVRFRDDVGLQSAGEPLVVPVRGQ
jgi:hypothetical protein